jgi:hypothetical protein
MSLINYIEPATADIAGLFVGLGTLIFMLMMTYLFFRLFMVLIGWLSIMYNKDARYEIIESKMLNEVAKKKGIDLDKELQKRKMLQREGKSIRKKMEEEVFAEMFGKQKESK